MDAAQCSQGIGLIKPFSSPPFTSSPSMEDMIMVPSSSSAAAIMTPQLMERRTRPRKEQQSLPCPRCNSTNTKFCYYNNYSLTQPRYFCKTCRRYWTEGGSLRNVPVGGGSRKNKKSVITAATTTANSSSSASASDVKKLPDPTGAQVMNSSFYGNNSGSINNQSSSAYSYVQVQDGDGNGVLYPNGGGFGFQSFLSNTVNFPMFPKMLPFENLAHAPQAFDQSRDQGFEHNSPGFWNGVVGGGGNSW